MANIIINNYCNQTCSYCFAWKNMQDRSLKKEMDIKTFLYCLKHLKVIGDDRVRILGGEPLLHTKIKEFFLLSAIKWRFKMTIFSNLKIPLSKWNKILDLWENFDYSRLKFNLNLNDEDFYKKEELDLIYASLNFLNQKWCDVIISYNIYEYSNKYDYIFQVARKNNVKNIVLKVTNTVYKEEELIDTNSREYGKYIYEIVRTYCNEFDLWFWCGLSRKIFTEKEIQFMYKNLSSGFGFGCENNGWRYDINTDGTIYRCYPLQSLYTEKKHFHIKNSIFQNNTIMWVYKVIDNIVPDDIWLKHEENCLGNQMNKVTW